MIGVVASVVVVVTGSVGIGVVTGGLSPRLLMEYFLPLALNFPVIVQPFSVANEIGTFWHLAFLGPVHLGVTLMTSEQSHLKETFMVHLSLTLPHLTWPTLTVSSTAREEEVKRRRRVKLRSLIFSKGWIPS